MASADQVRWQYYLSNSVDGKGVGWYDYDLAASDKLETKWQQQLGFGAMHRYVQCLDKSPLTSDSVLFCLAHTPTFHCTHTNVSS